MTVPAEPPRASVVPASARAVVFSETMRRASARAARPPRDSFISRRPITRWLSKPSSIASWVNCIQFLIIISPCLACACAGQRRLSLCVPFARIRASSPADRLPRGSLFLRGNRGRFVRCNILVELLCNAAYMRVLSKPIPPRRIR